MRHPVYNVRYSVVPINSPLLTIALHFLVRITFVYDDTYYDVITGLDSKEKRVKTPTHSLKAHRRCGGITPFILKLETTLR